MLHIVGFRHLKEYLWHMFKCIMLRAVRKLTLFLHYSLFYSKIKTVQTSFDPLSYYYCNCSKYCFEFKIQTIFISEFSCYTTYHSRKIHCRITMTACTALKIQMLVWVLVPCVMGQWPVWICRYFLEGSTSHSHEARWFDHKGLQSNIKRNLSRQIWETGLLFAYF